MAADQVSSSAADIASAREDFIKRLFAVTLSVGIANQISRIFFDPAHIVEHRLDYSGLFQQWQSLLLLLTSLAIIVSSWQGYLAAIKRLPLNDSGRFIIDIALVFSYLFLTLFCQVYDLWFLIHTFIFIQYLIWDWLRSRLPDYKQDLQKNPRPVHKRSMTITIVWLIYFVAIFVIKRYFTIFETPFGFLAITIAAFAGVILYRTDKKGRWNWTKKFLAAGGPLIALVSVAIAFHLFKVAVFI